MDVTVTAVAQELAHLQRNRGLQVGDLAGRVGPALASLTGFSPDRGAEARQSLVRQGCPFSVVMWPATPVQRSPVTGMSIRR